MEPIEILEKLKALPRFASATFYHRMTFECTRRDKQGQDQEVTITILDAGPDAGIPRYHCFAETPDGRRATGNPDDSLEGLLAVLHWGDLDVPPTKRASS